MGMIQKVVGRQDNSDTLRQEATKVVLNADRKESLLTMATSLINELGLEAKSKNDDAIAELKKIYTAKGTVRVSYKKSHAARRR